MGQQEPTAQMDHRQDADDAIRRAGRRHEVLADLTLATCCLGWAVSAVGVGVVLAVREHFSLLFVALVGLWVIAWFMADRVSPEGSERMQRVVEIAPAVVFWMGGLAYLVASGALPLW